MHLQRLKIQNLRNISNAEIFPSDNLNIITGANGAGKTTLLESIYLLARTRSFRQSQNRTLIKSGEEALTIFSELQSEAGTKYRIGLSKKKEGTTVHKDRKKITKLSELAKSLPLTIITPNIQRIVEEGPVHRRKLLNWGMFHVEPFYAQLAQRYNQTISQRNRALSGNRDDLKVWTRQLVELGDQLNQLQKNYLEDWNHALTELSATQDSGYRCRLELYSGWRKGTSFEEALDELTRTDRERGFTSAGPHRLDVKIYVDQRGVKNYFSRGQNKLLALNLMLAQTMLLQIKKEEKPILLVDDLQSELDQDRCLQVLQTISDLKIQTFITDLTKSIGDSIEEDKYKMFHVEHGQFAEI
ncbi:MAG: DNA replication/repair protein RecF [Candidatus Thiodiazotropha lotti]|nr:DNA replication/repair protein RecF [Candidatus Thiodiazotropha lotti]MCW4219548.1 DNA replication/repair protein RecF [Candidatus Thiodiazotropha lotti]